MRRFLAPLGGLATLAIVFTVGFAGSGVDSSPVAIERAESPPPSGAEVGSASGSWFFAPQLVPPPAGETQTEPVSAVACQPVSPFVTPCAEDPSIMSGLMNGSDGWRYLVSLYFASDDVARALQIVQCESGGNPHAANPTSSARGLFQHLGSAWERRAADAGWAGADIFDPEANVAVAAWLVYEGGGWSHWNASGHCW